MVQLQELIHAELRNEVSKGNIHDYEIGYHGWDLIYTFKLSYSEDWYIVNLNIAMENNIIRMIEDKDLYEFVKHCNQYENYSQVKAFKKINIFIIKRY